MNKKPTETSYRDLAGFSLKTDEAVSDENRTQITQVAANKCKA